MGKTGILTITAGDAANSVLANAIAARLTPPAVQPRGTVKSIIAAAISVASVPLSFLVDVSGGRVAIFTRALTRDNVSAAADIGSGAWRDVVPNVTNIRKPAWDVKVGGNSVLTPLGAAPEGQTAVEAAISDMLRPVAPSSSITDIVGMVEDALLIPANAENSALFFIRQDSAAGAADGSASFQVLMPSAVASVVDEVIAAHGALLIDVVHRSAVSATPTGPFGG